MIIRVVQLSILPHRLHDFLRLFEDSKEKIRGSAGCMELSLLQDMDEPGAITTLSKWKDADALEKYRQSEFFRSTWSESKTMFAGKARAVSYQVVSTTD